MQYKLTWRQLTLFFGRVSVEFYWPNVYFGQSRHYGVYAKTLLVWRPEYDWRWNWAFAAMLLGFGFGVCHNHVSNPNHLAPGETT